MVEKFTVHGSWFMNLLDINRFGVFAANPEPGSCKPFARASVI